MQTEILSYCTRCWPNPCTCTTAAPHIGSTMRVCCEGFFPIYGMCPSCNGRGRYSLTCGETICHHCNGTGSIISRWEPYDDKYKYGWYPDWNPK